MNTLLLALLRRRRGVPGLLAAHAVLLLALMNGGAARGVRYEYYNCAFVGLIESSERRFLAGDIEEDSLVLVPFALI